MKPKIFFISGPSASGKTTLAKSFLQEDFQQVISHTTREKRKEENFGDYHFVSKEYFQEEIKNNNFLEYNEFCGNYYGTHKDSINSYLDSGINAIKIIDVNGFQNIKKFYSDSISIFIDCNKDALKERMNSRGDSQETVQKRLNMWEYERSFMDKYDYIIDNSGDFSSSKLIFSLILYSVYPNLV